MTLLLRLTLLAALALSAASLAAQERSTLLPDIPAATGEPHAEGNEYWRRNHMNLMKHDRDSTLRDGDRDIAASLNGCFDCHAAKNDAGQIVTYESEQHFCRSCHDYVAVKVDCFMCHRSTPDGVDEHAIQAAILPKKPLGATDIQGVVAYLKQSGSILTETGE